MPRVPYPDPAELPDDLRAMVERGKLNVIRMMVGATPEVCRKLEEFSFTFYRDSSLPADLREVAILRVGKLSGSAYEVQQHEAMAQAIGLTRTQVDAILAGDTASALLDPRQKAVMAYVDDILLNVRAGDATLTGLMAHLTREQLIDLTLVTGLYMTVARLLETTGVELDSELLGPGMFD
jgi:alkylhydroperoxidase family enzyme